MKVLDVDLFQEGLQRNISMLTRLSTEVEEIHRAVEGLVQMEDQLKGEGGNAIRSFYEECHLPFLQFFQLFSVHYQQVLHQMEAALYSLEPDSFGYILEAFLEGELEQGLTEIGQLTASLTDETNSIMDQVSDIVGLPHLDDSGVQEGVISSKRKRDDTISQLYEFDATQTSALHAIEQDIQTMETWLWDLEGMFESGLTSIHFQTENWGVLTSNNNLKTDLAYRTSPIAVLSTILNSEKQLTTMLQTFLDGTGPIRFGYGGIINIHNPFVGTDLIALSCPRPECNVSEQEVINQNPLVKSFHSFKGIAHDFWDGVDTRREKSLDSTYDFINYAAFGVTDGILSGAKERKDKMFESKTDFANYATLGFSGMVKEVVSPEESFSKEHWQNSFGLVGSIFGLKLVTSPVKKSVNAPVVGKAIDEVKNVTESTSKTGVGKTGEGIPLDQVKPSVLKQIYRDDDGAYGYLPREGTPYREYDFTDIGMVKQNRAIREDYIKQSRKIQEEIESRLQKANSIDEIAKIVVNMRNQDKAYARTKMSPEQLAPIEKRNKEIYGNSLGPDAKWLFDRKKRKMLQQGIEPIDEDIWQSIIQSSMKKDEVLNTLLGIKHK